MRLGDVPVGERVILRENMDGGTGMIRETHYVRVGGDARYPSNVNVTRVRAMQGIPGERLVWDTGEYHAWSEASAAIQVSPYETAVLLAPVPAAPLDRPKMRVTIEVDPAQMFDAIQKQNGDFSSLGERMFTALISPRDFFNNLGLLAVYGIQPIPEADHG